MKRAAVLAVVGALLASGPPAVAGLPEPTAMDVGDAVTELDVERARDLLAHIGGDSAGLALERARLSLYVGDCDAASAILATLDRVKEAASLSSLARNCARATAGSLVIEDGTRGLWIRLQDESDRPLIPLLSDVAVRARDAIERDLGVKMPRPLRIDLVRDLFSLSAVSGLPLGAAETTGTVAVARWGRVNMISPRAARGGFPWEDTLAHEITHLAITRATRDTAPLWLQEGLAKRQEIRWRAPRPFDGDPPHDAVARDALLSGESVGVDKLGPSIAMLPSADAASIAFAEVASFVDYWIRENGRAGLKLLFLDLKGIGTTNADSALTSVSGYDLSAWILRWQDYLRRVPLVAPRDTPEESALEALEDHSVRIDARARARSIRTAELLFERGAPALATARLRAALASDPRDPGVRWRLGRSLIAEGRIAEAAPLFQSSADLEVPHPGWFALQGRYRRASGNGAAVDSFDFAVALDPYLEDAACEGEFAIPGAAAAGAALAGGANGAANGADGAASRALCEAARKIHKY